MNLERFQNPDLAAFILRLCFGGLMLMHGWPKAQELMNANGPIDWADPIGLGPGLSLGLTVFAEVIAAIGLLLGIWTRWMTIPLIVTMIVASQVVHRLDSWGDKEHSLLYLGAYLAIFLLGPGKYSVDGWLAGKKG